MRFLCYNGKNSSKGGKNMRKYYLDNIRWGTIMLVVLYHVLYMFNGTLTDGVIGSVTDFHGQDSLAYLLYPWFMVLLFIVSGMCARYYLEQHSDKEFFQARTRKLLVPSTIGLFVFGWIQGYFNMAISDAFRMIPDNIPIFVRYSIMVVSGTGVLWTIQVMWICSLILLLIRKLEKNRLWKLGKRAGILVLLLLGVAVWGSAQILNTPVIVVYRFGIYGFSFLLGYYVLSHEEVTDELVRYSIPLLVAAVLLGGLYLVIYNGTNYATEPVVNCPLAIAYAWITCLAVLGAMKRWGNRTGAFASFMTKRSFGLYVFHYLALSIAAYSMVSLVHMKGVAVYILSAIAAFGGGLLLNAIISRIPVVRWCVLGIKKEKRQDVQG